MMVNDCITRYAAAGSGNLWTVEGVITLLRDIKNPQLSPVSYGEANLYFIPFHFQWKRDGMHIYKWWQFSLQPN